MGSKLCDAPYGLWDFYDNYIFHRAIGTMKMTPLITWTRINSAHDALLNNLGKEKAVDEAGMPLICKKYLQSRLR